MAKTYVGAIGIVLRLDTKINIASASVKQIKYRKPDGSTGSWTATIVDGQKLKIISTENTWDQSGVWMYQSYIEMSGTKERGESVAHRIYALYD